jgi:anti-sigma factor RsiW
MSRACAEWRGDVGAYIVGGLSPQAGARVRRHLQTCPSCRADYEDLVPVRDLLDRASPVDGLAGSPARARPPLEALRQRGNRIRPRWLAATALGAAATIAVIVTARPAAPVFHAFDRATGAHGQAQLRATPSGTQISLTVSGLPADQRCIIIAKSSTSTDVAGTWTTTYAGAAHVEGTSAIPVSQLTTVEIESPSHRLLLQIQV